MPWLRAWMKMYILAFQVASDIDPGLDCEMLFGDKIKLIVQSDHPRESLNARIRTITDEELKEVCHFTLRSLSHLKLTYIISVDSG